MALCSEDEVLTLDKFYSDVYLLSGPTTTQCVDRFGQIGNAMKGAVIVLVPA